MAFGKVQELGNFIRDQRRNARLSLRKMSQMAGISNPYLSQIERGLRRPSAEILQAIAKTLRISAETLYVKAGILEEHDGDVADPVTSILRDQTLNEKQKQLLIEIYQSFRHENELSGDPRAARATSSRAKGNRARPKRATAKPTPARRAAVKRASAKRAPARKTKGRAKAPAKTRSGARRRSSA